MIDHSVEQPSVSIPICSFSVEEWGILRELKIRYLIDHDLFNSMERGRLEFVRWLYVNGRLDP